MTLDAIGDLRMLKVDRDRGHSLECLESGSVLYESKDGHPTKDESFVILRGKVRSTTYNDDGSVIESVVLCQEEGVYGVDIPKGVWHKLESLDITWLNGKLT